MSDQHDMERVYTADLAAVIDGWIAEHEAEHPKGNHNGFKSGRNQEEHEPAIAVIAQDTGLDRRSIYRIRSKETITTSFWLADRILTALSLQHKLNSLPLVPVEMVEHMRRIRTMEEWQEHLDKIGCRR